MYSVATNLNTKNGKWWADFQYKNEEFINKKTGKVIDATP
jgi:hypothetical protein